MTIHTIVKKAIKRLELEGKLMTPEFYAEAFCKEAKKAGMNVDDCNQVDKFSKTLNKDLQKEITNYRVKTMGELARFLISKLNRTNSSQCSQTLEAQTLFIKKILQVISSLHNQEATELAKRSMEMLNSNPTSVEVEQFKQLWTNFSSTYDDTFLQKLKSLGSVDTTNLKKTVESLNIASKQTTSQDGFDLSHVASLLASSFVPSISSHVDKKIQNLSNKIKTNPELLNANGIEKEVRSAIALRIASDKESVKEMISSLDNVLDKLSLKLINMIEKSNNSNAEIQGIKKELKTFNEDSSKSFKLAHKKLFTIATALEENTLTLSQTLKDDNQDVTALKKKVQELEMELKKAKEESKTDFLTKLYNKRALDEYMELKEAEFQRYEHNYAIVMFDLDHFKNVNDTYGHEAGDAVLSAFAKILKKDSRTVDIVGRFGGEEFLALLSNTDLKGGVVFAEKVRKHVEGAKFMYKGQRIGVTVSSGVSERKIHTSLQAVVNSADEYLYNAKKNGRNQVGYKK